MAALGNTGQDSGPHDMTPNLLSLVEEAESLTKELFNATAAARQKPLNDDPQIMEMLMKKNEEIEETLKKTEQQREKRKEMESLQEEVDRRDCDVKNLQKHLKEAEHILATAIYQAKQKLDAIDQASKGSISSEELIKYAHRISATNAVAAPSTWSQGDPRRPYPTDLEMRMGALGRFSNLPLPTSDSQGGGGDAMSSGSTWQPSCEVKVSMNIQSSITSADMPLQLSTGQNKENEEDVEIMSTDSTSSSSSDSP
ncbi:mediator of RNA polymerase II transcription subunit 4-like [Anneissia japonica]|uniref:mediator of RNA polymerase II transcription subunit 4-like n=1 Tax=Anneissia japonica TaxID=1529436 RepID=UPI001425BB4D|nr:mediator of RNA polymerase II transcription subunit 4-like [Anneissia japonica]